MRTVRKDDRIAAVILAAGKSRRYGKNKLLEQVHGKSIIEWTLGILKGIPLWKIVVVVSENDEFDRYLDRDVIKIVNRESEDGLGTSIAIGAEYFLDSADGILFLLADQPLVSPEDIEKLLSEFIKRGDRIVACSVNGMTRNPVIFPPDFFEELTALRGDRGAREIADHHEDRLIRIETDPDHLIDVDTAEDLKKVEDCLERRGRQKSVN